jgi:DNA-binding NarL/FixJ family response regulator
MDTQLMAALRRVAALERERDDYRRRYEHLLERTERLRLYQNAPTCDVPPVPSKTPPELCLTEREAQIAHLIALGLSDKEIARDRDISLATVRTYIYRAFRKLRVDNRVKLAVAFAEYVVAGHPLAEQAARHERAAACHRK